MKKKPYSTFLLLFSVWLFFFLSLPEKILAQFTFMGNAYNNGGGCYVLTPNLNTQQGTAWYNTSINLSQPFTIQYNLNFGTNVANGADGIAFVIQNQGTGVVGASGGGIGYQGITPSVVVEFDTWQNGWDPDDRHVAVTLNGDPIHTDPGNAGCPIVSFPFNLKDGNWHSVQITWDPVTHTLQVYFGCQLWLTYSNDIVNNIFSGNPQVWWGFTASTGGATNLQQFCFTPPFILTTNVTNACYAQCNGSAAVTNILGGTAPYTYAWSNGQTTSGATGLCAGTYTLNVTSSQGCVTTQSLTITQPAAALVFSGISSTNEFCNRSDGTALVTVAGGNAPYSYLWNPSAQITSTATGLAAGNYSVTVTDANGCTRDTMLVVNFTPGPTANAGASVSICSGSSTTLNGSGGGNYSWTPAIGLSNAIISNPVANPNTTTTYTLIVTDANNCSASDNMIVTVNPTPVASFTAPNVCFNNSTVFTNTSTGGTNYSWSFGDGNTSTAQSPNHTYNNFGTFIATLTVTNTFGCSDTFSNNILVNPLPSASFSSTTVCIGGTTCFTDASTIPTGNITAWSWNFNDPASGNNISNTQNPCHQFSTAGTYTVILTVTSDSGCQSTTNLHAFVQAPPVASFTAPNVCLNTPTIFTSGVSTATQWYWQFGDGGTSTIQNPTHTYLGYGNYIVTLIITDNGICSDTAVDTVIVYSLPIVNFHSDTVCLGKPTSFSDLSFIPAGSIVSWHWNFGDGNTSTVQNPTHVYASAGTHNVTLTVTSNNGCISSILLTALVYSLPHADFSTTPDSPVSLTDNIVFNDLSTGGAAQWAWSFGDSTFSTVQTPSHVYSDTGAFMVTQTVVSQNGCVDSIQHLLEIKEYAFYIPNAFTPNGDGLNDFFYGEGLGILEYEMWVFDRWGDRVFYCKANGLPQSVGCRWDGTVTGGSGNINQQDVYVWKVHITNVLGKKYVYTGSVTVVH